MMQLLQVSLPFGGGFLDSFFVELVVNILVYLFGMIVGIGVTKLHEAYRRRQNFFRPELEQGRLGTFHVVTSSVDPNKHRSPPTDGVNRFKFGDGDALTVIFGNRQFRNRTYLPEEFHASRLEENLISIGGEVSNPVTQTILEKLHSPLRFEGYGIVDRQTGKQYFSEPTVYGKRQYGRDYGIVIRSPNPWDPHHTVYVFAGCHSYGTTAASQCVSPGSAREVLSKTRDMKAFVILVETELFFIDVGRGDYYQSKPHILVVYPLNWTN